MVAKADTPPAATVSVSALSVSESFTKATEMVARPLASITAFPLREPLDTSALLTPDKV